MAPGLNTTDPLALSVHGTNPQNLIESITRNKIYNNIYWKTSCFGLSSSTLLEKAVELKYIAGNYGPLHTPSPFICLALKLLQIAPPMDVVFGYIKDDAFKYLRALGCFYLRLVGSPLDIYRHLEPCLEDPRRLNVRTVGVGAAEWEQTTVDQFVWKLLTCEDGYILGIQLPRLPRREVLEASSHFRKMEDPRRPSKLRGDPRVKELVKKMRRIERIEAGIEEEKDEEEKRERKKRKKEGKMNEKLFKNKDQPDEPKLDDNKKDPEQGSVEYWNREREKLGLSKLK